MSEYRPVPIGVRRPRLKPGETLDVKYRQDHADVPRVQGQRSDESDVVYRSRLIQQAGLMGRHGKKSKAVALNHNLAQLREICSGLLPAALDVCVRRIVTGDAAMAKWWLEFSESTGLFDVIPKDALRFEGTVTASEKIDQVIGAYLEGQISYRQAEGVTKLLVRREGINGAELLKTLEARLQQIEQSANARTINGEAQKQPANGSALTWGPGYRK